MFKLTEVQRQDEKIQVKLDGILNQRNLPILTDCLEDYVKSGIKEFHLGVHGVPFIEKIARQYLVNLQHRGFKIHLQNPSHFLRKLIETWELHNWVKAEE